jgi:hypothetical protein
LVVAIDADEKPSTLLLFVTIVSRACSIIDTFVRIQSDHDAYQISTEYGRFCIVVRTGLDCFLAYILKFGKGKSDNQKINLKGKKKAHLSFQRVEAKTSEKKNRKERAKERKPERKKKEKEKKKKKPFQPKWVDF